VCVIGAHHRQPFQNGAAVRPLTLFLLHLLTGFALPMKGWPPITSSCTSKPYTPHRKRRDFQRHGIAVTPSHPAISTLITFQVSSDPHCAGAGALSVPLHPAWLDPYAYTISRCYISSMRVSLTRSQFVNNVPRHRAALPNARIRLLARVRPERRKGQHAQVATRPQVPATQVER
jgi:hypothetical protein